MEMEYACKVKEVEQCRISPPPSPSIPPTSLPLTFFDIPWLCFTHVERLFFYEFHHPLNHFMDTVLPNIKHSLSLALQHFFPLAGNLTWPLESYKPQILCTDADSIPLTVAESNQDFNHLVSNHPRSAAEFYPLVPMLPPGTQELAPLLALQVTVFPNSGICIGITISHVVADGQSSNQFIKYWASLCRLGEEGTSLMAGSLPFYDRTVVKDPYGIEMNYLNDLKKFNISQQCFRLPYTPPAVSIDKVRATFVMGLLDLEKLKRWVTNRLETRNKIALPVPPLYLSKFVLTYAYASVCLIKSRDGEGEISKESVPILFPVDCRARLDPPLPKTYFGNCLMASYQYAKREDLIGEDGIAIAAEVIGNGIRRLNDGVFIGAENLLSNSYQFLSEVMISVAGSPKLAVYETDFGWGRPKKVEVISIELNGAISLSECSDREGELEIGLVLNKHQMNAFASLFENTLKNLA